MLRSKVPAARVPTHRFAAPGRIAEDISIGSPLGDSDRNFGFNSLAVDSLTDLLKFEFNHSKIWDSLLVLRHRKSGLAVDDVARDFIEVAECDEWDNASVIVRLTGRASSPSRSNSTTGAVEPFARAGKVRHGGVSQRPGIEYRSHV